MDSIDSIIMNSNTKKIYKYIHNHPFLTLEDIQNLSIKEIIQKLDDEYFFFIKNLKEIELKYKIKLNTQQSSHKYQSLRTRLIISINKSKAFIDFLKKLKIEDKEEKLFLKYYLQFLHEIQYILQNHPITKYQKEYIKSFHTQKRKQYIKCMYTEKDIEKKKECAKKFFTKQKIDNVIQIIEQRYQFAKQNHYASYIDYKLQKCYLQSPNKIIAICSLLNKHIDSLQYPSINYVEDLQSITSKKINFQQNINKNLKLYVNNIIHNILSKIKEILPKTYSIFFKDKKITISHNKILGYIYFTKYPQHKYIILNPFHKNHTVVHTVVCLPDLEKIIDIDSILPMIHNIVLCIQFIFSRCKYSLLSYQLYTEDTLMIFPFIMSKFIITNKQVYQYICFDKLVKTKINLFLSILECILYNEQIYTFLKECKDKKQCLIDTYLKVYQMVFSEKPKEPQLLYIMSELKMFLLIYQPYFIYILADIISSSYKLFSNDILYNYLISCSITEKMKILGKNSINLKKFIEYYQLKNQHQENNDETTIVPVDKEKEYKEVEEQDIYKVFE